MLNNIGLPGLLLIAVVTLVLFGKGKVSSMMGEMGKGISAFKHGLQDGEAEAASSTARTAQVEPPVAGSLSAGSPVAGSLATEPLPGALPRTDTAPQTQG